jgi:hypothetical protein
MQSTPIHSRSRSFELKAFSPEPQLQLKARVLFVTPYIEIEYQLENCVGQALDLVSEKIARFSETLWQKTCFEFFLRFPEQNIYWEWNWNPLGHWGAFCFDGERQRGTQDKFCEAGLMKIESHETTNSILKIKARFHCGFSNKLSWLMAHPTLLNKSQVSLNAVLLDTKNKTTHWALKHTTHKADFHKFSNFIEWQNL